MVVDAVSKPLELDRRELVPPTGLREFWYPALLAKQVGITTAEEFAHALLKEQGTENVAEFMAGAATASQGATVNDSVAFPP